MVVENASVNLSVERHRSARRAARNLSVEKLIRKNLKEEKLRRENLKSVKVKRDVEEDKSKFKYFFIIYQ